MDNDLFLIFSFILLAALILLGWVSMMHKRTAAHDECKLELKARQAEAERVAPSDHIRKLEERVRVLERLATDRGVSLADEIESLRAESPALADRREKEKMS